MSAKVGVKSPFYKTKIAQRNDLLVEKVIAAVHNSNQFNITCHELKEEPRALVCFHSAWYLVKG